MKALLLFCSILITPYAFGQKVSAFMANPGNLSGYPELNKKLNVPPKLLLHYSVFRKNNAGGQNQTLIIAIPEPDSIVIGKVYSLPNSIFLTFYDASALDMRAGMNKIEPENIQGTIKVLKYESGKLIKLKFDITGQTADKTNIFLSAKKVFKPSQY